MSKTLYTAPDCLRCRIIKNFMEERKILYTTYDFKADKYIFNAFYRNNRPHIYRNAEGVEFPILHDEADNIILQGCGESIAYLLSGRAMRGCVRRSDLLHGWISGLALSFCPPDQKEAFLTLVRSLAAGGLNVLVETDGRNPDLLDRILAEKLAAKVIVSVPGPAELYPDAGRGSLRPEELARTLAMLRPHPDHAVRLLIAPMRPQNGAPYYISPEQAAEAAQMVCEAGGDMRMPFAVQLSRETCPPLEPLPENALLPYRGAVRRHLVRAEIVKE